MLMRTQAANRSSYFFKKNYSVRLTAQEFCDVINSNGPRLKALINRIICFSSTITGTRAFWSAKRRQLDAWYEHLARLIPRYDEWCSASDAGKARIARENLKNSPHIAASYFGRRFKSFLKSVMIPNFAISDY
ncbi:hypothetical protein E4U58_000446, partial [Claviceps cyperi]